MQKLYKSERFQSDYKRFKTVIEGMPEGKVKAESTQLLQRLVAAVKRMDEMHMELAYAKQLPSTGVDMKSDIIEIRKDLEDRIKAYA